MAVFAMKGFMILNQFMDGGVTGISILIHEIFHINISILVVIFNLPFIYLGFSNSEIIMLFNTFIFAGAAFHFGYETAMYSLIT